MSVGPKAIAVHDLRDQLHVVLGYAELLRTQGGGLNEVQLEWVAKVRGAGKRMLTVVEALARGEVASPRGGGGL